MSQENHNDDLKTSQQDVKAEKGQNTETSEDKSKPEEKAKAEDKSKAKEKAKASKKKSALGFLFAGKYLIYTTIAIVAFLFISSFSLFKLGAFSFGQGGKTSITAAAKGYKKIDTLFTSFAYVPIVEFKTKQVAASTMDSVKLWGDKKTVEMTTGYCVRRYDVGIGYENVTKLIEANKDSICKGDLKAIPEPEILTTASTYSKIFGDYTQTECDSLDRKAASSAQALSSTIIKKKLGETSWKTISQTSKNILLGFSKIYCDENTANDNQNSGENNAN